jgi:hypothetical protein
MRGGCMRVRQLFYCFVDGNDTEEVVAVRVLCMEDRNDVTKALAVYDSDGKFQ